MIHVDIGIDPGVRECGVAIQRVRSSPEHGLQQVIRSAFLVRGSLVEMLHGIMRPISITDTLSGCIEGQQFYGTERSKGDPQDLIRLAQVAGAVQGALMMRFPGAVTSMPLPRTWKGTIAKAPHHERLARDYPHWVEPVASNTPQSKQHHVWDAVGLLIWHKERTERRTR